MTVTVDSDELLMLELELLPLEVEVAEAVELLDVTALLPPGTFRTTPGSSN